MKTIFKLSVLVLSLGFGAVSAFASSSESARVIRADKVNFDLLIERQNGELWVLQHNPLCNSMTTEFPVSLDRKSTRLNSSHSDRSRMPSSA